MHSRIRVPSVGLVLEGSSELLSIAFAPMLNQINENSVTLLFSHISRLDPAP